MQFAGDFRLESARITTHQNTLADSLSRLGDEGMGEHFISECAANHVLPSRVPVPPETFGIVVDYEASVLPTGPGTTDISEDT